MAWIRTPHQRYIDNLRTALLDNHNAMMRGLLHTDRARLDVQLAEFMLREAEWTLSEFITACSGLPCVS